MRPLCLRTAEVRPCLLDGASSLALLDRWPVLELVGMTDDQSKRQSLSHQVEGNGVASKWLILVKCKEFFSRLVEALAGPESRLSG